MPYGIQTLVTPSHIHDPIEEGYRLLGLRLLELLIAEARRERDPGVLLDVPDWLWYAFDVDPFDAADALRRQMEGA